MISRTLQRRQVAAAVPASRSGPDAIRAAALEATRPSGSQQQAGLGQRGVHLPASRHRTAVNQGERRAGVVEWSGVREKAVGFNRPRPLVLLVFGAPGSAGNI